MLLLKDDTTLFYIEGQIYNNTWRALGPNSIEWDSGHDKHTLTIEGTGFRGVR